MTVAKVARARLLTMAELADRLRISKRSAYRVAREMPRCGVATIPISCTARVR